MYSQSTFSTQLAYFEVPVSSVILYVDALFILKYCSYSPVIITLRVNTDNPTSAGMYVMEQLFKLISMANTTVSANSFHSKLCKPSYIMQSFLHQTYKSHIAYTSFRLCLVSCSLRLTSIPLINYLTHTLSVTFQ